MKNNAPKEVTETIDHKVLESDELQTLVLGTNDLHAWDLDADHCTGILDL